MATPEMIRAQLVFFSEMKNQNNVKDVHFFAGVGGNKIQYYRFLSYSGSGTAAVVYGADGGAFTCDFGNAEYLSLYSIDYT
ncbi:hypothetical protein [Pseudomonas koreensis]|uniref:hypothetical protein n=1 Tax=Pseudomonas koreensis TaxID=198620 RepID=UPI001B329231|nr:hypothetical protein [Pseudomonas koreensis]MBP4000295.1 hypothetical protein [Pseudomonas koreensis]